MTNSEYGYHPQSRPYGARLEISESHRGGKLHKKLAALSKWKNFDKHYDGLISFEFNSNNLRSAVELLQSLGFTEIV